MNSIEATELPDDTIMSKNAIDEIICEPHHTSLSQCAKKSGYNCSAESVLAIDCNATGKVLKYSLASPKHLSISESSKAVYSSCMRPKWRGDGSCDDINNHPKCEFDGGDCCGENVDTSYCQKCTCLQVALKNSMNRA